MVDAVEQVAVAQVAIAGGAGGGSRRRTGGGHQVWTEGAEKVRPGHQGAVHFKVRHAFLGILGVEIGKLNAGAVVKTEDEVVSRALHGSLIRGELQDQAGIGHTFQNCMLSRLRTGKDDICHCICLVGSRGKALGPSRQCLAICSRMQNARRRKTGTAASAQKMRSATASAPRNRYREPAEREGKHPRHGRNAPEKRARRGKSGGQFH